jgi:sialate O-acetylesterase
MVLQQSTRARVWGRASASAIVSIKPNWTSEVFTVSADSKGEWDTTIITPAGSYDIRNITFESGLESITIRNVLIGEVWLTAGQSNMEMALGGFSSCPVLGANEIIAKSAKYKFIRAVIMPKTQAKTPLEYVPGSWAVASPWTTPWWSAVSFYFARTVQKTLDVPIGIIISAWGGTPVQGWMPEELLVQLGENDSRYPHSTMYNGLIYPVRKYTLKGFLWYQGEANVGQADNWLRLMVAMVQHWRELWGLGVLPFYNALIAPCEYGGNRIEAARMREAQRQLQFIIPNSGAVNTLDLVFPYERYQAHPANKKPVGQRFAWLALRHAYGFTVIFSDSSVYEYSEVVNGTIWCHFSFPGMGLSPYTNITGLEIANESRIFVPAIGNVKMGWHGTPILVVSSPEVTTPVAVRYCFRDFQIGNLVHHRNLPVFAFRTDNWPLPATPANFWEEVISRLPVE